MRDRQPGRNASSCLCAGISCRRCHAGRIHRPISDHCELDDHRLWHTPYFGQYAECTHYDASDDANLIGRVRMAADRLATPHHAYGDALPRHTFVALHGTVEQWHDLRLGAPPDGRPLFVGPSLAGLDIGYARRGLQVATWRARWPRLQRERVLHGEEARDRLLRVTQTTRHLHPSAGTRLRERSWNAVCFTPHLVAMLEPATVRAALHDPVINTTGRVLLLRAHPDADHQLARAVWEGADLTPRLALDVLRATGPHCERLARQSLASSNYARHDGAAAARVCAAIVSLSELDRITTPRILELADDRNLPATVRAVAANVARAGSLGPDPAMRRYERWLDSQREERGLSDVLSGAWLHDTML